MSLPPLVLLPQLLLSMLLLQVLLPLLLLMCWPGQDSFVVLCQALISGVAAVVAGAVVSYDAVAARVAIPDCG